MGAPQKLRMPAQQLFKMDFAQVCTLLLQSPRRNAVQDAATFARLLCVSKQLQGPLLAAAQGCIRAEVRRCCSSASTDRSVVQWLCQHMRLGTIRHVEVEADDFKSWWHPDLYALLTQQLSDCVAAQAAGSSPAQLEGAGDSSTQGSGNSGDASPSWTSVLPSIFVSWHVCGLPPSSLPHLPGATFTHLTLRDSTPTSTTAAHLATLTTLRSLHLPNLNRPAGATAAAQVGLERALAALTALTSLFIRDPQQQEQQMLPVSLRQLTVAQRRPPWTDEDTHGLAAVRISHLTALTSLTVHEWLPQGITEQYLLPSSLQHLAAVCVDSARPLLRLTQLRTLQLSSLLHSQPGQLLQLSSLPALTALHVGSDLSVPASGPRPWTPAGAAAAATATASGPPLRVSCADLRDYVQVFAAVPVVVSSGRLVVVERQQQQEEMAGVPGAAQQPECEAVLTGLRCLKGLRELRLGGQPATHNSY